MTKEDAKQLLPIIQAFAEGEVIECRTKPCTISAGVPNEWTKIKEIGFWNNTEYRIKPKPKYIPYRNLKECFRDMKNHEPFGYIRQKQKGDLELIIGTLDDEYEYLKLSMSSTTKLKTVFERYTYFDGSPFGIKVEE